MPDKNDTRSTEETLIEVKAAFAVCTEMAQTLRDFELSTVLMTAKTISSASAAMQGGDSAAAGKELDQALSKLKTDLEAAQKSNAAALDKAAAEAAQAAAIESAKTSSAIPGNVIQVLNALLGILVQFSVTLQQDVNAIMDALTSVGVAKLLGATQPAAG